MDAWARDDAQLPPACVVLGFAEWYSEPQAHESSLTVTTGELQGMALQQQQHGLSYEHDPSNVNFFAVGSDDATTSSGSPPRTRKKRASSASAPTRSVNLSRERRKKEIASLKRMMTELQGELGQLQHRRDEMLRVHVEEATGQLMSVAPVWEGLAKRQFQARRKAEMEMAKLKAMLATQAQVAKELIQVIERAQQIEAREDSMRSIIKPPQGRHVISVQMQLDRLNILCGQWFVALSWHAEIHNRRLNFLESKVVSDDGLETVLDVYSNQAFPFSVAQVEEAIWNVFHSESSESAYAIKQECETTNDTLIAHFRSVTDRQGVQGALTGAYVTRRFRNNQGHFMTASNVHGSFGSEDRADRENDGYILMEDTWVRVLDVRDMPGTITDADPSTPLTVLQHVRRSRIRFTGDCGVGDARIRGLMAVHVALTEAELRWGQLTIESMLMTGDSGH